MRPSSGADMDSCIKGRRTGWQATSLSLEFDHGADKALRYDCAPSPLGRACPLRGSEDLRSVIKRAPSFLLRRSSVEGRNRGRPVTDFATESLAPTGGPLEGLGRRSSER
jgi:hypothetical protein